MLYNDKLIILGFSEFGVLTKSDLISYFYLFVLIPKNHLLICIANKLDIIYDLGLHFHCLYNV